MPYVWLVFILRRWNGAEWIRMSGVVSRIVLSPERRVSVWCLDGPGGYQVVIAAGVFSPARVGPLA